MISKLFALIDWASGKWLDWRTDQAVKELPHELKKFDLKKLEMKDSTIEILAEVPAIAEIANQIASALEKHNIKNYISFDMMPRWDHAIRPIRVTVQWANGESPATKAARLEAEVKTLREKVESDEIARWQTGHPR